MEFPIYDISEETWVKYKENNIIFENPDCPYIKPRNRNKYLDRIRKFIYVDCNGDIYKITDYRLCEKKGIWKYIPFMASIEFQFIKTGEHYSFEKFKDLMIKRAIEIEDGINEKIARNATSFRDILATHEKKN